MNEPWQASLQAHLGGAIQECTAIGGGDFADAYRVRLADAKLVFVKTHKQPPTGFFTTEARGLSWLRALNQAPVPEVFGFCDDPAWLALEWVQTGQASVANEHAFGVQLARMHRVEWSAFGRADRCTTGSLGLPNHPTRRWSEFYAQCRLLPLAALANERKALPAQQVQALELLAQRLGDLGVPEEPPALVHGDLWAGNRLVDKQGQSWLIDPAAHGGHREFDLAMMRLFGGFGAACFAGYESEYPLARGWQQRVALHQLAPLVVHAIKFGGHYVDATRAALEQYV